MVGGWLEAVASTSVGTVGLLELLMASTLAPLLPPAVWALLPAPCSLLMLILRGTSTGTGTSGGRTPWHVGLHG